MSDYAEDSIDVQSFSNFSSAESLGCAYRAEATHQWTASSGITVKTTTLCMRLVVQFILVKLKYQKKFMVKLEMCWNNVWQPAARQQDVKQKGDPVHEKKPQQKM